MTENQRLRELLKEAREFVECFAGAGEHSLDGIASFKVDLPKDGYPRQVAVCAAADTIARIDAALAEPPEQEETEHAMHLRIRAGYDKTIADCWRAKVAEVEKERDEALAEKKRLKWDLEMSCEQTPVKGCECRGCYTAWKRAEKGEA
jgi:hypothetical protein